MFFVRIGRFFFGLDWFLFRIGLVSFRIGFCLFHWTGHRLFHRIGYIKSMLSPNYNEEKEHSILS